MQQYMGERDARFRMAESKQARRHVGATPFDLVLVCDGTQCYLRGAATMTGLGTDTDWPACSVEFCPRPGEERIFACGTYKLDTPPAGGIDCSEPVSEQQVNVPHKQTRRGKCLIYELQDESGDDVLLVGLLVTFDNRPFASLAVAH
jgi:hypothetical protein